VVAADFQQTTIRTSQNNPAWKIPTITHSQPTPPCASYPLMGEWVWPRKQQ